MSFDLEDVIRAMKEDTVQITAEAVVAAVKAVGAMSIMPSPAMPMTGLLLHVHPKVYDRLQKLKLEAAPQEKASD